MTLEVREIATPELVSETVVGTERISVRLVGSAEGVTQGDLNLYLESIHRAALEVSSTEVMVDLSALEFMSAGCLRSFLVWLALLQRSQCYVARFVSDEKKPWQKRTLQTLASYAGRLVQID